MRAYIYACMHPSIHPSVHSRTYIAAIAFSWTVLRCQASHVETSVVLSSASNEVPQTMPLSSMCLDCLWWLLQHFGSSNLWGTSCWPNWQRMLDYMLGRHIHHSCLKISLSRLLLRSKSFWRSWLTMELDTWNNQTHNSWKPLSFATILNQTMVTKGPRLCWMMCCRACNQQSICASSQQMSSGSRVTRITWISLEE